MPPSGREASFAFAAAHRRVSQWRRGSGFTIRHELLAERCWHVRCSLPFCADDSRMTGCKRTDPDTDALDALDAYSIPT